MNNQSDSSHVFIKLKEDFTIGTAERFLSELDGSECENESSSEQLHSSVEIEDYFSCASDVEREEPEFLKKMAIKNKIINKYKGGLQNSVVVEVTKEEEGGSSKNKNPFDVAREATLQA